MDVTNEIVICKHCHRPEWWGAMRWLSGCCLCRDCYRAAREQETHDTYKWNDLEGERPTMEQYQRQEVQDAQGN